MDGPTAGIAVHLPSPHARGPPATECKAWNRRPDGLLRHGRIQKYQRNFFGPWSGRVKAMEVKSKFPKKVTTLVSTGNPAHGVNDVGEE